jgi:hypothetical protein
MAAAKRSRPAWRRHELVSKAIFEALLKQSNAENLEVKHNVCIKGLKTCHQIDVFWKFRMGGLDKAYGDVSGLTLLANPA